MEIKSTILKWDTNNPLYLLIDKEASVLHNNLGVNYLSITGSFDFVNEVFRQDLLAETLVLLDSPSFHEIKLCKELKFTYHDPL